MAVLQLSDWVPDQSEFATGASTAHNVIRTASGYRPLASLQRLSSTPIPPPGRGMGFARSSTDQMVIVAGGNDNHLYRFNAGALDWTDVSKGGSAYTVAVPWNFAAYGDFLIGACGGQAMQVLNMAGGTEFADLSASAPDARYVTVIRDQVFAGYITDDLGQVQPSRIAWCAIDNPTDWVPNQNTLCDFQDVPDMGALVGLVGGSYGVALFEEGIVKITFVGPPVIYQIDRILNSHGCIVPGSVTAHGSSIFYLSPAGWEMFDGQSVSLIGAEQIDNWFYKNDMQNAYLDTLITAVDPLNHILLAAYAGKGTNGSNNRALVYNFALRKWTSADLAANTFGRAALPGYTLEQLDFVSASIDDLPASLDSSTWSGGRVFLGAIDHEGYLCNFTGPPPEAIVETAMLRLSETKRTMLQAVYPLLEGDRGMITAEVWTKARSENEWRVGPRLSENREGWIGTRKEGRFHRLRFFISGYWTHFTGCEYLAKSLGLR